MLNVDNKKITENMLIKQIASVFVDFVLFLAKTSPYIEYCQNKYNYSIY